MPMTEEWKMMLDRAVRLARRKGNVLFTGAPGTGKTSAAMNLCRRLGEDPCREYAWKFIACGPDTTHEELEKAVVDLCLGIRDTDGPEVMDMGVLILDDLDRADAAAVLGDWLPLIDADYAARGECEKEAGDLRWHFAEKHRVTLPRNFHIVATASAFGGNPIDARVLRRFAAVPLGFSPAAVSARCAELRDDRRLSRKDFEQLKCRVLQRSLQATLFLKERLRPELPFSDYMPGAAYFLADSEEELADKTESELKPLFKSYWRSGFFREGVNADFDGWLAKRAEEAEPVSADSSEDE